MAMLIALTLGVSFGVLCAVYKGRLLDSIVNVVGLVGISTPNFWLGIMLIFLFSVHLGWLPASGYVSPFEDFGQSLKTTIMPAFVLGNAIAGVLMRHTRGAMLQALASDYVRTARAKGLDERAVYLKHALRNALIPIATGLGSFVTVFFSGSLLIETIFQLDGIGLLGYSSVLSRDYNLIMGSITIQSFLFLLGNLISDLTYVAVDPRIDFS
jgi:peptide/nickel transport system permease protein